MPCRKNSAILFAIMLSFCTMLGCQIEEATFTIRIENISADSRIPTPLSPGVFAVHDRTFALFVSGEEHRGNGLEALAEDGKIEQLERYIATTPGVHEYGVFSVPAQEGGATLFLPQEGAYEFTFTANNNAQYLSLITMFVESNDLFFAFDDGGIKLFRLGAPINGDVTKRVMLWDAHTEINEEPGKGVYQVLRQTIQDSGPSETGAVSEVNDAFNYPAVDELIRVTISSE